MAIGLFLAIIVNQKIRGQTFFRGAYYFPAIASSAAITILWIFIVSPFGLFNSVREALGSTRSFDAVRVSGRNKNWIGDQDTALNSVIILNAWTTSGHVHALLPGLAAVDQRPGLRGGRDRRRERLADVPAITFPLLRPGHYFVATVAVIGALQLFDQAAIAGGPNGDPNNALMTVVLYLYNAAFAQLNFGYAAAVGVILFVVIFGATLVQRRAVRGGAVVVSDGPRRPRRAAGGSARTRRATAGARAGPAAALAAPRSPTSS